MTKQTVTYEGTGAEHAPVRDCLQCGTEFAPRHPAHDFCQPKCRAAWHREQGKVATGDLVRVYVRSDGCTALTVRMDGRAATRARGWVPGLPVQSRQRGKHAPGTLVGVYPRADSSVTVTVRVHADFLDNGRAWVQGQPVSVADGR